MSFASCLTGAQIPPTPYGIFLRPLRVIFTSSSILRCNANSVNRKRWQVAVAARKSLVDETTHQEKEAGTEIRQLTEKIRWMLQHMEDGEISVSPYDTAWVALVEDIDGNGGPQFPTSLEWIAKNQLEDGSWGDRRFLIYDRLLNTLACVVALTAWKLHPHKCNEGLRFLRENIEKVEDEAEELMPVGFEVAFPSLIETAKKLGIEIPYDECPGMKNIYAMRELKLKKIPMDLVHKQPTSLLFSLEGMEGLVWEKLLNFLMEGSFLSSPSSTAYALRHTKDQLCLRYLLNPVEKFNGGVPNAYPVDLFEHIWSVDRLQRLGISRFFQVEIEQSMKYVHRYWTNNGICWARNGNAEDVDCTSMGFRLLRLHGYDISIDAFRQFEKDGEFCCMPGQSTHAITGMYSMYKASQLRFPDENMLVDARNYAAKFLHQKRLNNAIRDKWIIAKDLPSEVGYALDVPFYASLPRLEARFYLEQYGGDDDVWIGKTLYRRLMLMWIAGMITNLRDGVDLLSIWMAYVSCDTYLELAKLDYKNCQTVHQLEWKNIQKWYNDCNLMEFGLSERSLLQAYYIAASSAFEPEKSVERLAWAKTAVLIETIASQQLSHEQKGEFVDEFVHGGILKDDKNGERHKTRLVDILINTVSQLSSEIMVKEGRDINQQLSNMWKKWIQTWAEGGELGEKEARLLLHTLHLSSGVDESSFTHPKYHQLLEATSKVCNQLRLFQNRKQVHDITNLIIGTTCQIEAGMQEVVKLVFTKSAKDLDSLTKQSFFTIATSFYYTAYCDEVTINSHIDKVLFENID